MSTSRHHAAGVAALSLLLLLGTACGDDDGSDVRNLGEEDGSGSGSGAASGSGSGSASGSASGVASCSPVGEDLEGDAVETIGVELSDYAFGPTAIEAPAGIVTFEASNIGEEDHELAVLPGGGEVPFTEDGAPDEAALEEAGAFELEAFPPGETCNATWELEAGDYTLFCIVESPDGETHYEKGMQGTLTVG